MSQPRVYLGGEFLAADQASIPLSDAGFMLGATVTEQLRTYAGRLSQLDRHLARLFHSLEIVGFNVPQSQAKIGEIATELVASNHPLLADGDDLGLCIFVTPGPAASLNNGLAGPPLLGMHTFPLPFALWADKYTTGQRLCLTDVEQTSAKCWPPELKCRSRMHYYLADRAAKAIDPEARAVLRDADGHVTELTTANLVLVRGEELLGPPRAAVLPGISLSEVIELAKQQGMTYLEQPLHPDDLRAADEIILSSTPFGLLPAVAFEGKAIGSGKPGPRYHKLLAAYSEQVGIDVAGQATRFTTR